MIIKKAFSEILYIFGDMGKKRCLKVISKKRYFSRNVDISDIKKKRTFGRNFDIKLVMAKNNFFIVFTDKRALCSRNRFFQSDPKRTSLMTKTQIFFKAILN